MTRKTIGLLLISSLFILACAGVPGVGQPTPTALPMPTDFPTQVTAPTLEPTEASTDVTEAPGGAATEAPTDQPTDAATDEASVEPTDVPDLAAIDADSVGKVTLLKELKVPGANTIAISPQSDSLASAEGNSVVLYDMPWPAGVVKLDGHTGKVNSVSWSSDGTQLVSGSDDGTMRLWDTSTGKEVSKFDIDGSPVTTVAWSPDGGLIAAGTKKGTVKLIDGKSGDITQTIAVSKDNVALGAITWSADGSQLATALYQGTAGPGDMQLWDADSGEAVDGGKNAKSYMTAGQTGIAWSPLDDIIAWVSSAKDGQVALWTIDDSKTSLVFGGQNKVNSIAWSPDGDLIATAGADRVINVWETTDGKSLGKINDRDTVNTVAWAADGTFLVTAVADGFIRIWGTPEAP